MAVFSFCALVITSSQFAGHYLVADQVTAFFELTLLVFLLGFLANLINNPKHGLRRWPIYFAASQLMVLAVAGQLSVGRLTLSSCGLALFIALFFNGLLRVWWRIRNLPVTDRTPSALLIELLLLNLSFLLLAS
jgi:hypothetical protein